MSFISIKPSAALTGLVESLWDCDWAPTPHCLERVLPSAYGQLIVNLYEDETREYFEHDGSLRCVRLAGTTLAGPQALSGIIDTREQRQVMGVILHPPGAMAFARQALDQLHGHSVDVAALPGAHAAFCCTAAGAWTLQPGGRVRCCWSCLYGAPNL